ncbi:hypothetical protein AHAS_Ahas02G0231000 [Arachis hypogaea]
MCIALSLNTTPLVERICGVINRAANKIDIIGQIFEVNRLYVTRHVLNKHAARLYVANFKSWSRAESVASFFAWLGAEDYSLELGINIAR